MYRLLLLGCLFVFCGAATAKPDFSHYQRLAASGAKQLAIDGLKQQEPDMRFAEERWLAWLAQLVEIYEWNQQWAEADKLLKELPPTISAETRRWAATKRVSLALQQGKPTLARRMLQQLLWRPALPNETIFRQPQLSWSARWRRLLIDSYLQEGREGDAALAMQSYRQDYSVEGFIGASGQGIQKFPEGYEAASSLHMRELEARIAIAQRDFATAWELLKDDRRPSLQLLRAYAELLAQPKALSATVDSLSKVASDKQRDVATRKSAYILMAKGYALLAKPDNEVKAIFSAIAQAPLAVHAGDELAVPDSWYWQNLSAIGSGLISAYFPNKTSKQRFQFVSKVGKKYERIAIYLRLALTAEPGLANDALIRAYDLLEELNASSVVLTRLFTEVLPSSLRKSYSDALRLRLVQALMSENRLAQASEVLLGMRDGAAISGDFNWHLRRARIHLLGGQPVLGAQILAELLLQELDVQQYDRLLQVVFDVQTVGLHEYALDLLLLLQSKQPEDVRRQREMWYWLAEVHKALQQPKAAAEAYLLSADYVDANATDQWAITARLAAAEQLAEAGFAVDAKALYSFLLLTARKDNVRAMLRTKIQRLSIGE